MEENNIPNELTYHEPIPLTEEERKDPLYITSYIVSAIFTPFMVPFVAFLMIFIFTYLSIMPLSYKLSILALVYCFTILFPMLGIYIFQKINGWGIKELGHREKRFDVSHPHPKVYERHHIGRTNMYGAVHYCQSQAEGKYSCCKQRTDGRRTAVIQFPVSVQSRMVAGRLHPTGWNAMYGPHYRTPTYINRGVRRICPRIILWCHRNFVYLKRYTNLVNFKTMNFPTNVKYTNEHEWIRLEGEEAYVGITDYAQTQLGDIVFVDVPTEGETLEKGETFGSIEVVKTVSDLFLPVGGEILEVNPALEENPELVNKDPYGEGWIIRIKPTDVSEAEELLDAEAYKKLINE